MLMQSPEYASDVTRLLSLCASRGVAAQTIKSVARRRWREGDAQKRFSWHEPVKEPTGIRNVVHYVLCQPNIFLNTSSDATILPSILRAASEFDEDTKASDIENVLRADSSRLEMEPIFVRGVMDTI